MAKDKKSINSEVENLNRKSFVVYFEWFDNIGDLQPENFKELIMAIQEYAKSGIEPKLDGVTLMAFKFIKGDLERDLEKYIERAKTNKANGLLGGRPKTQPNPTEPIGLSGLEPKPKKPDNDDDNVDDNDDVDENENKEKSDFVVFNGFTFPATHIAHSKSFMDGKITLETFMLQNKIKTIDGVKTLLMEFNKHLNIKGKTYTDSDYIKFKEHFVNWYRRTSPEMKSALKTPKKDQLPDGVQPAEWLS